MQYEWILFDADHTLFDFDRASRESLEETLASHGIDPGPEHWTQYDAINKSCWAAFERGEMSRETMRTVRFARFFEHIGREMPDIGSFSHQYLNGLPTRPYVFPETMDILNALNGRVRLGIVTNGLAEVQRPRLMASGIDRYCEVIIVSGEIGHMKPHRQFFAYAHARMSHPERESVLVVGDSLDADVRGGAEYGFHTCWYNPGRLDNMSDITPHYTVDTLHAVVKLAGL